jgi:hypothetical protein
MPPSLSGPPGVLHPLFPHLGWGCSACPLVAWSNEECGPPFVPEERGESPGQEDGACSLAWHCPLVMACRLSPQCLTWATFKCL